MIQQIQHIQQIQQAAALAHAAFNLFALHVQPGEDASANQDALASFRIQDLKSSCRRTHIQLLSASGQRWRCPQEWSTHHTYEQAAAMCLHNTKSFRQLQYCCCCCCFVIPRPLSLLGSISLSLSLSLSFFVGCAVFFAAAA